MTAPSTIGSYRFIAELGHGGMADVYLAAVEGPAGSGFTKLAVVKMLRSNHAEDPDFVSMLMDEARVTARLAHPNVVQLFEVGHVDNHYFLAMEFLEGQPLHRVARRVERVNAAGGDVPRDIFYAAVSDVLAGLHHAHELTDYDGTPISVVHRDVTPHNVFVTYDGVVKVVDFGIAQAKGRQTQTQHGVVKGKIRYMSPEQAACSNVDRRTDVFAAGVMLFNLATGTKLWGERTDAEVAQALFKGDYPRSPRERNPEVPEAIDAICRKALASKREDRYPTAAAMRADIEAFLAGRAADVRKKLTATMKGSFERERAQLRKVLEASALSSVPSVATLAARAGRQVSRAGRAIARRSRPERTEVMAGAPARQRPPPSEEPSLSPMSSSPDLSRSSSRSTWIYGALALAVVFALVGRFVSGGASAADLPHRNAASVASELTMAVQVVHGKASRGAETDGTHHASGRGTSSTRASDAPATQPEPELPPPSANAAAQHTKRVPGPLDAADPWSSVKR